MNLTELLLQNVNVTLTITLPQLDALVAAIDRLGDRMADALDPIRTAIEQARATLTTELAQIAEAIRQAGTDPVAVQAVAADVDELAQRIANIIPDVPPAP
jgi:hypothetical protein